MAIYPSVQILKIGGFYTLCEQLPGGHYRIPNVALSTLENAQKAAQIHAIYSGCVIYNQLLAPSNDKPFIGVLQIGGRHYVVRLYEDGYCLTGQEFLNQNSALSCAHEMALINRLPFLDRPIAPRIN